MKLPEVNILVYAHRDGMPDHERYRSWLESLIDSDEAYGMADTVLSGFLRIVTNPRAFPVPSTMAEALGSSSRFGTRPTA